MSASTTQSPPGAVSVISLGGTIAMAADVAGAGVVPSLDAAALLAAVPGLAEAGFSIRAHTFRSLPGASLTLTDLAELVTEIHTNRSISDARW